MPNSRRKIASLSAAALLLAGAGWQTSRMPERSLGAAVQEGTLAFSRGYADHRATYGNLQREYQLRCDEVRKDIRSCRDAVCRDERITEGLDALVSYWEGTRYSFSGDTQEPRKGSIACGYFVSTLLKHVGYRHSRTRVAQLPADKIIRRFCDMRSYRWYSDKPVSVLKEHAERYGRGYYLLGLDTHVAFLRYDGEGAYIIHSSPFLPGSVVRQDLFWSPIVFLSRAKVIAKLDPDKYGRY